MSNRILVVEDEADLVEPLLLFLESQGYRCEAVPTGSDALERVRRVGEAPDVVLLDLMLPDMSGVEVCRTLRADPATAHIPIIMVTARVDEYDKVVGFEVGADDYVTKPYSLRELSLRVAAVLRRVSTPTPVPAPPDELRFAEIGLDRTAHKVRVADRPIEVSVVEFDMLETFLANVGRALTRDEIRVGIWGDDYAISERAVDTNVKRLRQKLGEAGRYIETVRGVGYRWVADPAEAHR